MPLTLHPAATEDSSHVANVLLASRKAFLPYAPLAHSDVDVHRWVRDVLIPSGGVTVACEDGAIVGVLATSRDETGGWVDQLYVTPTHVGQGTGTRLLAHALASLPLPVRLHTFQANVRARAFYERHGFKAVEFSDGRNNEERCPDVLYELAARV